MKILCLCRGGNVRSVALAWFLKYDLNHDALACGIEKNSPATRKMLYEWADAILYVEPVLLTEISERFHSKSTLVNIGPDVWGDPTNKDLLRTIYREIEKSGFPLEGEKK